MNGGFLPDREEQEARHERGDPRDSMLLQATMCVGDGASSPLRVRNLSAGGLMGEGGPALSPGQAVTIELRNIGKVKGRIAWTEEARFGVAFDNPVDPQLARKTVGTRAADTALVPPVRVKPRRPGLRIE
ncbi:MAG: hypothetical protein JWL91_1039 [Sphingomonas bacterium]|nr:PilZ domain-containing protein [Sphingomonas bacterium]MDB5689163.1 hypothetical protein [Sphingomonas bacterium]